MNKSLYFEDLFNFIKFVIFNKFIFIFSILFFSFFSMFGYYYNYTKYADSIYNVDSVEISKQKNVNHLRNEDLVDRYKFDPFKRFTKDEFNFDYFYGTLSEVLITHFNDAQISYELIKKNHDQIIFEFYNYDNFENLINEEIILNYYKIAINKFIQKIEKEIEVLYEDRVRHIYNYILDVKHSFRNQFNFNETLYIYNRLGARYLLNELCRLDHAKDKNVGVNQNDICNVVFSTASLLSDINKFLEGSKFSSTQRPLDIQIKKLSKKQTCRISNVNVRYDDILYEYVISDLSCPWGIFPDKIVFEPVKKYLNNIKKSNPPIIKFSQFERNEFDKPNFIPYLLSTIVFGFFFGLIIAFLLSFKKILK